jgi:hypothetical protein
VVLALVCAAGARPALAQGQFEVPAGCGGEAELKSELERLLGERASEAWPARLSIKGPDAQGAYTLRLEVSGQTRELGDPDCRTLLRTAAVIAAAALREELAAQAEPAPPVPPPAQPPPPAPAATPAARPTAAPRTPANDELESDSVAPAYGVFLGAGAVAGVVPELGFSVLAGGLLEPAPFGVLLSVGYIAPRLAERGGRGVDVSSLGARLLGLLTLAPELQLQLGVEAQRLSGTGADDVSGRQSNAAWRLAPVLGLGVTPWPNLQPRLELALSGQLAVLRPRFIVDGFGDVYPVPRWGADAIIRGVWLFR